MNRAVLEVNACYLKNNLSKIKKYLRSIDDLICVLKANAYGHDLVLIAEELYKEGVRIFAVANIHEAMKLRYLKDVKIIIMSFFNDSYIDEIIENEFIQTLYKPLLPSEIELIAQKSEAKNKPINIALKINSGLNRLGFDMIEQDRDYINLISNVSGIKVQDIFTHIGKNKSIENLSEELSLFEEFVLGLNIKPIDIHIFSSNFIDYKSLDYNVFKYKIRCGDLLYGLNSFQSKVIDQQDFDQIARFKTHVEQIRFIYKNIPGVGYNRVSNVSHKYDIIGILPIGFADGYPKAASKKSKVIIKDTYCDVVEVNMHHTIVDLNNIKENVKPKDTVILFGKDKKLSIDVNDLARDLGLIPSELMTGIKQDIVKIINSNI